MLLTVIVMMLFVPLLRIQQRAGHMDYGLFADLQVPIILFVLLGVCWRLLKGKSSLHRFLLILPLTYVLTTAATNILGELFFQADHSRDLPIRGKLVEYSPPNPAPTRAQIVTELGPPVASAFLSRKNTNLPKAVEVSLRFTHAGAEVLVYEETARNGRRFTYYIFIDPATGRKGFHCEVPGELPADQWPNQPLR